jgi:hypothetical protein
VAGLTNPQWVEDEVDGSFFTNAHEQPFQFGSNELTGLLIFLSDKTTPDIAANLQQRGVTSGIGNCASCHAPPAFTDFIFHNNGAAQEEYDSIHGAGTFASLSVPSYASRSTNYNAWLPPTTNHPDALGIFEMPPTTNNPGQADLGLWTVFENPDYPAPQDGLQQILPQLLGIQSPQISRAAMAGNHFFFNGTNGMPGAAYYVLTSTNLALPLASWSIISTNNFDGQGNFGFTNSAIAEPSRGFYAIKLAPSSPDAALAGTIALFKTPTVRDLVASEPYLHTGRFDTVEDIIGFYQQVSQSARVGTIRNADPQLKSIMLDNSAIAPLAAFLRSLNEAEYVDIPCPCQ